MKKGIIATLAALSFAFLASTLIGADEAKPMAKKPDAPAAETKATVYSAKCSSPCHFSLSSDSKEEVSAIIKQHAKAHHNMDVSDKDIEGMIKTKQVVVK